MVSVPVIISRHFSPPFFLVSPKKIVYAGAMLIDMHLHSVFSDGTLTPQELVDSLVQHNVNFACLTDHDTFGGTPFFLEAAKSNGIASIPAIEIDCIAPEIGYDSEILCYFPEGNYSHTESLTNTYRSRRLLAVQTVIEHSRHIKPSLSLKDFFVKKLLRLPLAPEAKELLFNTIRITSPELYAFFIECTVIDKKTTYKEFKKRYTAPVFKNAREPLKPHIKEVIAAAKADNGIVVLPHFGHEFDDDTEVLTKEYSRAREMLAYFQSAGIEGLEWYAYRNHEQQKLNELIHKLAEPFNFVTTFGCDFHGSENKKNTIIPFEGEIAFLYK